MTSVVLRRQSSTDRWPTWAFDAILWTLILGPIVSPLFRATGLPLVADSGLLARELLATYICPTPDRSIMLLGLPMAVCVRCWGATLGLLVARVLVARAADSRIMQGFLALPWAARLLICALPFLLWPLEIVGQVRGWWFAPLGVLLLNGAQAGLAAGLFFCSVWPGMWARRAA